jgi:polyisoprenyl-teichoic acid--peptidoglycan teichoic acid transferase
MVCYSPHALETTTPAAKESGRSPSVAALLSFVWPGLGQLYAGKRRLAAIFAIPVFLLLIVVLYQLRQGGLVFATRFIDPSYALLGLAVVLALGAWRLAAVIQPFVAGERGRSARTIERAAMVVLVALIVITHGYVGYILADSYNAEQQIFTGANHFADLTTPAPSANAGVSFDITPSPSPTATTAQPGRVTMLFTGMDAAPGASTSGRSDVHYDSIMVVSFDPRSNTIQMVSIPREVAGFKFYFGGRDSYGTEITYMPKMISRGSIKSPDSPYMTLVNEVQYLVGVHIDYWAIMNLTGFTKMVDAVGGIDINVPSPIDDYLYDWTDGTYGVHIAAGQQHLNGRYALAYARDRKCVGCNDYKRAARQQVVMRALLSKMSQPGQMLNLSTIISEVGASVQVSSNFKASMVPDYVAAALNVPSSGFSNIVLGPPYTSGVPKSLNGGADSICLNMAMTAAESIKLFGADSLYYGKPTPANTCP